MFSNLGHLGPPPEIARSRDIPPPTPVNFPRCIPSTETKLDAEHQIPLSKLLHSIQRPNDIKIEHLEALRLHVISDASSADIIPDAAYLPPADWSSLSVEDPEYLGHEFTRPLNNNRDSPGVKTYLERIKELSIPNSAAFRTIRRLPPAPGDAPARLGNAYEFFKNLELLSGFWSDTALPSAEDHPEQDPDVNMQTAAVPVHQQIHVRTGTGSQTPPDFRNALLSALVKLVAYDFGCNVSLPRIEPRLYIASPAHPPLKPDSKSLPPTVSFPSNISFIYRTPTDRSSARSGIVEGPLAALSARATTGFATATDELLDLCREIIAVLITTQQRARDGKAERKPDPDAWWCHKPRWGGGTGGPIGKEEGPAASESDVGGSGALISGISEGPSPKKSRRTMSLYDNYRMVRPPSSTWDRKARYLAIGKVKGSEWDDVFLLSALNHHVCVVRCRVPAVLLEELEGSAIPEGRAKFTMWKSRWWDMFLVADRTEAMHCIWGMMAWVMRKIDE